MLSRPALLRGPAAALFSPRRAPAAFGAHCGTPHCCGRSMIASLVVGTALTLLNQGDILFAGRWNSALYWKIPLTYCVPFLVATYGALANSRK